MRIVGIESPGHAEPSTRGIYPLGGGESFFAEAKIDESGKSGIPGAIAGRLRLGEAENPAYETVLGGEVVAQLGSRRALYLSPARRARRIAAATVAASSRRVGAEYRR